MIEPTYHYFENEAARVIVDTALRPLLPFFPSWTQVIKVFSAGATDDDTELSVESQVEYRRVGISIFAQFFDRSPEHQAERLRHELLHTSQGALVLFVKKRLLAPIEESNPELYQALKGELQERIESVTEELSFLLAGLAGQSLPEESPK